MNLRTADFDYDLPQEQIAQTPVEPRHDSRLLVLNRANRTLEHAFFWQVDRYLRAGDLLVINETRVIPSQDLCQKNPWGRESGTALIEKTGFPDLDSPGWW